MMSLDKLVCLMTPDCNFISGDSSMNTKIAFGAVLAALVLAACGQEAAAPAAPAAPAAEAAPAPAAEMAPAAEAAAPAAAPAEEKK
jgi:hypothetical protein